MKITIEGSEQLQSLRHKAEQVEELVSPQQQTISEQSSGAISKAERTKRPADWFSMVENAVLDLANSLPEGTEDYDARKLFEFLFELRRAVEDDPTFEDRLGEVELAKMRMLDVVHRIGRRLQQSQLGDPQVAVDYISKTLQGISAGQIAELLGVSTKTVSSWASGRSTARNARNANRLVIVAQLLFYLRASMTPLGLVMWFSANRDQLGGRTPLELLDEDEASAYEPLVTLARGARGQLAD